MCVLIVCLLSVSGLLLTILVVLWSIALFVGVIDGAEPLP